ncbi:MAG: hypothetical protein IIY94_00300 [Oscillospiraceae bacterium]|nr:hypothetical protein [Oscillospiraceae bacterium]
MGKRHDRISARQLGALALCAAGVPIFRLCCRVHWLWTLAGAVAACLMLSGLSWLLNRQDRTRPKSSHWRGALAPFLLGGAALAAWVGSFAFPETAGNGLAALLIFGLAIWAARIGPAAVGRCAGILLWVTGMLYGVVLLFSVPQMQSRWLLPGPGGPTDALLVWAGLSVPGVALCLHGALGSDQKLPHWPWWSAGSLAVVAAAVTGGILSPPLATEREAFRTLARGVSVLGVMRRFEALVNGAMLMSAFSLCALLLTAAVLLWSGSRRETERTRNQTK